MSEMMNSVHESLPKQYPEVSYIICIFEYHGSKVPVMYDPLERHLDADTNGDFL